jgi:ubiquitin-like 1-activating enzyme E1 B
MRISQYLNIGSGLFSNANCSLNRLSHRWKAIQSPDTIQVLTFDKDDMDTLDFVASTSNIRSTIFSIPPKSKFDIKRLYP